MNHWFTSPDAPIVTTWVKRFDPLHWTVDFPRGTIASTVTSSDGHGLTVDAEFLRKGDLVGLIFESEDKRAHSAHARETNRDYSKTQLSFRWQSTSAMPLDAVNGPTLTIEGRDSSGNPQSWFVRLWNYAAGTPDDAVITVDFNALDGGFSLPADANRVEPGDIDRMFISIVPPDYAEGSQDIRSAPAPVTVTISEIACTGSNSVLSINDAVAPEHGLRIATAYDDMYDLPPERVIAAVERLGFRGTINHYVGMSHYFALDGAGLLDSSRTLNAAALAWHRDLARGAAERGYGLIWSVSYEILDMFCPDAWKQRAFDGSVGLTAWDPPSALVSPASANAIGFLGRAAAELAGISVEFGLQPQVQIGEPWWWVMPDGALCLYDDAAKLALGGNPAEIADVRSPMSAEQLALLDQAGELLATSTKSICDSVRAAVPDAKLLALAYLPTVLDPTAPELKRANLPPGWAKPAFDVLQLEDYEWVTAGRRSWRAAAYAEVEQRLGYSPAGQHYFAGIVGDASERANWRDIVSAADEARARKVAEVFLWALPQVIRDGLTIFGEKPVIAFDDVSFPIEIAEQPVCGPRSGEQCRSAASEGR